MTSVSSPATDQVAAPRGGFGPVASAAVLAVAAVGLCLPFAFGVARTEWLVWVAVGALAGFSLSGST